MFSPLLSSSALFLLSLLLFLAPPTAAELLEQDCSTTGNYTANSTYDSNLHRLLSNLTTRTFLAGGFSTATIGQSPDQIFGLAQCRGDINTSSCRSCLNTASVDILRLCPNYKAAVIWYDLCHLRYANQDFLSMTDNNPQDFLKGVEGIPDGQLFDELVNKLVNAVTDWAAFNSTGMFATGEVNFTTAFPKIYGLAQCTLDLTGSQCQQCLQWLINQIQYWFPGERGGTMLGVRCNLRYNVSKFYQEPSILRLASKLVNGTAPPAPHVVPPFFTPAREEGKGNNIGIASIYNQFVNSALLTVKGSVRHLSQYLVIITLGSSCSGCPIYPFIIYMLPASMPLVLAFRRASGMRSEELPKLKTKEKLDSRRSRMGLSLDILVTALCFCFKIFYK